MAHYYKFVGHPGVTKMHATLQQTYYWAQMAPDVTTTVRDCVHCAISQVCFRKPSHLLKLFSAFELPESVVIGILGLPHKSWRGCKIIILMEDRFAKRIQAVWLRRIRSVDFAQQFAEHWNYHHGAPKSVLSNNGKQFTIKFYHSVCQFLEMAIMVIFT